MLAIFSPGPRPTSSGTGVMHALQAIVCGLLVCCLASPVMAQKYKTIPSMKKREALRLTGAVRTAIKNPSGFGADAESIDKYFKRYYFPIMTSTRPADLGELGKRRENLFKQYIRAAANPDSQASLTNLSLKICRVLAIDNYHPAVRYNATLIIGNLDKRYSRGKDDVPQVLPEGTKLLLDLLEKDSLEFKGKQLSVHSVVKSGALVGLERHARHGVEAGLSDRLTQAMLTLIDQQERPEDLSKEVHDWMKCQAVAVLVQQFKSQPNAQLQNTLNAIAQGDSFELDDRCYVASLMENAEYENAQGLDGAATLGALAKLTQDVLKVEAKLAKEFEDAMLAGGGRSLGGGEGRLFGGGGRTQAPDSSEKVVRSRLLSRLVAIYDGGVAVAKGLSADEQAKVQELLDSMKELRSATRNADTSDLSIVKLVISANQDVNRLVQSWGGAAEDVEEADFS